MNPAPPVTSAFLNFKFIVKYFFIATKTQREGFYTAPLCQLHLRMHVNRLFLQWKPGLLGYDSLLLQVIQSLCDSMKRPLSANLKNEMLLLSVHTCPLVPQAASPCLAGGRARMAGGSM
jgi:hypothetical protein